MHDLTIADPKCGGVELAVTVAVTVAVLQASFYPEPVPPWNVPHMQLPAFRHRTT